MRGHSMALCRVVKQGLSKAMHGDVKAKQSIVM